MSKRILLLVATNVLVVLTISIIMHLLGVSRYLNGYGANHTGLFIACLVWGFGGAFFSLAISRIMAKMSMGVTVIDPRNPGQFGDLVETVHSLAQKAGLPAMPQVGVYDSPEINAFATGPTRSRALVAVSTGLLRRMEKSEVEGVLGHEIAHVANGDMVTMTLLQGVINAFVMFFARIIAAAIGSRGRDNEGSSGMGGNWMVVMLLEMVLSGLGLFVVSWFSRHREFRADAGGAAFAGKQKMIGALQSLHRAFGRHDAEDDRGAAIATLKISGKPAGLMALLSTHPPLEDRIARLQQAR
ncbi:MAG TPA: protease HtpX [Fibrobacteria bacterium]|nr:protease HtpX [Fibrobacteria bacterium]